MPEWDQEAQFMTEGNGMSKLRTGERLRALRERRGISRAEAARNCGISRLQLMAYERGGRDVPDSVVAMLARLYGVSSGEVVPSRSPSRLHVGDDALVAGDNHYPLPADATPEEVLDHYLDFIRELRGSPNLDNLPLRDADLDALATALGDTPKQIEQRLIELIHCSKSEAHAIRMALLRKRLVVPAAGFVLGMGGMGSAAALKDQAPKTVITDEAETVERIELQVQAPAPVAGERSTPPPAEEPSPQVDEPAEEPTNSAGEPITRSGTGENGDWAEVIPPLVITADNPPQ